MEVSAVILALKRAKLRLSPELERRAKLNPEHKELAWRMAAESVTTSLERGYKIEPRGNDQPVPRNPMKGSDHVRPHRP